MEITIQLDPSTPIAKQIAIKNSLQKMANKITSENLLFLAELSDKPDVNKKLESKKTMIKTFL